LTTSEKIESVGLTPKAIAIGIIALLIVMFPAALVNWGEGTWDYQEWEVQSGGFFGQVNGMIMTLFIIVIISSALPVWMRLKPAEYVVVITILMSGLLPTNQFFLQTLAGWQFYVYQMPLDNPTRELIFETGLPLLPPLEKDIYQPMLLGKSVVPWDAWSGPAVTWFLISVLYCIMLQFWALVWRKPLVESERLPFPYATLSLTLIEASSSDGGRARIFTKKSILLWLGLLIGFLSAAPAYLSTIGHLPVPQLSSMGAYVYFMYIWDFTPQWNNILHGGQLTLDVNPGMFGLFMLLPTQALLSIAVIRLLVMANIVMPISTYLGYTPWSPGQDIWTSQAWLTAAGGHGYLGTAAMVPGGMLAVVIWTLINHRRYLARTLTGKDETIGLSPKLMWGGLLLFSVLLIAVMSIVGMPVYVAVLLVLWILGTQLMLMVLRGSVGSSALVYMFTQPSSIIFYQLSSPSGTVSCVTSELFASTLGGYTGEVPAPSAMYLEALKIGYEKKTRVRDSLISMIVAAVIGIGVGIWLLYTLDYHMGVNTKFTHNFYNGQVANSRISQAAQGYMPDWHIGLPFEQWWDKFTIGFVVTIILYVIRYFWTGFPIIPVVAPVAFCWSGWQLTFLLAFIAFIIKYTMIRVGGATLFIRSVPLWVGLAIGWFFGIFIPYLYYWLALYLGITP